MENVAILGIGKAQNKIFQTHRFSCQSSKFPSIQQNFTTSRFSYSPLKFFIFSCCDCDYSLLLCLCFFFIPSLLGQCPLCWQNSFFPHFVFAQMLKGRLYTTNSFIIRKNLLFFLLTFFTHCWIFVPFFGWHTQILTNSMPIANCQCLPNVRWTVQSTNLTCK